MRAQSAIEFLSTYGFLFAILGVSLSVIAFLVATATSSVPGQCYSYSGPSCNFVSLYSNTVSQYSLITLSITNTEDVPINLTSINVTVRSVSSIGACAPQLVYSGQEATCVTEMPIAPAIGSTVQGTYSINAKYCDVGLSSVSKGGCLVPSQANYDLVYYGGSFTTAATQQRTVVFSVAAAVGPKNFQGQPYLSFVSNSPFSSNGPTIPLNFTITQNGDWVSGVNANTIAYSFATANGLGAPTIYGRNAVAFPQSVNSSLGTNSVACSAPFNSTLSLASTVIYMSANANANVVVVASNAIDVFLKQAGVASNTPWNSIFEGTAWGTVFPTNQVGPYSVPLNQGLYYLEILWEDFCGSGVQEFAMTWPGTGSAPIPEVLTVTNNGCASVTGSGIYNYNSIAPFSATPSSYVSFNGWTGSGTGSYTGLSNPSSVTMDNAITETGTCLKNAYSFTELANPSGSGTLSPGNGAYNPGSVVTINEIPAAGYTFSSWTGSGTGNYYSGASSSNTFTITGSVTETANFAAYSGSLTCTTGSGCDYGNSYTQSGSTWTIGGQCGSENCVGWALSGSTWTCTKGGGVACGSWTLSGNTLTCNTGTSCSDCGAFTQTSGSTWSCTKCGSVPCIGWKVSGPSWSCATGSSGVVCSVYTMSGSGTVLPFLLSP
jgi:hypothetical protein